MATQPKLDRFGNPIGPTKTVVQPLTGLEIEIPIINNSKVFGFDSFNAPSRPVDPGPPPARTIGNYDSFDSYDRDPGEEAHNGVPRPRGIVFRNTAVPDKPVYGPAIYDPNPRTFKPKKEIVDYSRKGNPIYGEVDMGSGQGRRDTRPQTSPGITAAPSISPNPAAAAPTLQDGSGVTSLFEDEEYRRSL